MGPINEGGNVSQIPKKHTGRNIAIGAGVALGATAVIMSAVALSKLGTLNEGLMDEKGARTTQVQSLDERLKCSMNRNDSLFRANDSTIKTVQLDLGQKADASAVNGQVAALNRRVNEVDSSVVATCTHVDQLQQYIDGLRITDSTLKADLQKLSDSTSSVEKSIFNVQVFMALRKRIDDWNSNRGGFIFGIGAREELRQISAETFRRYFGTSEKPNPVSLDKAANENFTLWLAINGVEVK